MPHSFTKIPKDKVSEYAVLVLAKARALIINKVFGVVREVLSELSSTCPPPGRLDALRKRVDSVDRVVLSIEKTIASVKKLVVPLYASIAGIKIYIDYQIHIRPDLTGLPVTGPVGSATFTKRLAKIFDITVKIQRANEILKDLEAAVNIISFSVKSAEAAITPILASLEIVRALIDRCYTKQDLTDEERKELISNIERTSKDQLEGISFTNDQGQTYTIKIINDPNSPPIALKRQAIAQDYRGITVLTGPSSFASSTDILVDEMKYRLNLLNRPPVEPEPRPRPLQRPSLKAEETITSVDIQSPESLLERLNQNTVNKVTTTPTPPKLTPTPDRTRSRRVKRRFSEVQRRYTILRLRGLEDREIKIELEDFGANRYQINRVM